MVQLRQFLTTRYRDLPHRPREVCAILVGRRETKDWHQRVL